MDILSCHRNTYDELADEYETRVAELLPVTKMAMDYFAAYVPAGGTVLDVGCAVGSAMHVLSGMGFIPFGCDISPKMTAFAARRNPNARVWIGDFCSLDFGRTFDGVLAFAFIHLFPKREVGDVFRKIHSLLSPNGVALLSSTESSESKEGWFTKGDYHKKELRFRKFWTESELSNAMEAASFEVLDLMKPRDPFGKVWMDFVVRKA